MLTAVDLALNAINMAVEFLNKTTQNNNVADRVRLNLALSSVNQARTCIEYQIGVCNRAITELKAKDRINAVSVEVYSS